MTRETSPERKRRVALTRRLRSELVFKYCARYFSALVFAFVPPNGPNGDSGKLRDGDSE
jgi:hypothetical protein